MASPGGRLVLVRGPCVSASSRISAAATGSLCYPSHLGYSPRAAALPPEYTPLTPSLVSGRISRLHACNPGVHAREPFLACCFTGLLPSSFGVVHGGERCYFPSSSACRVAGVLASELGRPRGFPGVHSPDGLTPSSQRDASPGYTPGSPSRRASSPDHTPETPRRAASPDYTPESPPRRAATPDYAPLSPQRPATPEYTPRPQHATSVAFCV
ncbi:hypothetical protein C2845_PM15G08830 [Panicum miliaceum]|uniref:Uncharacterized protein n=1 Tax=Panicum miliaceum TaxID=4540 RepID=A0A3L6QAY1_PANMI|nr:hypothetical protein C2845_PM15G08830 [Panicum miliaceum]